MIHHYFGTKHGLFAAAHELPFNPSELIDDLIDGPRDTLGERIARFYITVIGAPGTPAVSMIRAAATNEAAARMLREFIENLLLVHAERLAAGPDPRLRMALVGSHMIGIVFARSMIGISELVSASDEPLVAAVAPAVQYSLTAGVLGSP